MKPKETSAEYGASYQQTMLGYYRKSKTISEDNTEYLRVRLAFDMVEKYVLPGFDHRAAGEIRVVDVGCSVGLFAIEFAKKGYRSLGIDFDEESLKIARMLNSEENTNATFQQMDAANLNISTPIDIAICFDLFEHLHDDEIGSLLVSLRHNLHPHGSLVFHTLPMEFDYLFWNEQKGKIEFPRLLRLFRRLPVNHFLRMVRIYALWLELIALCTGQSTRLEKTKTDTHCNPLSMDRVIDILKRAGYSIQWIESGFLGEIQLDPRDRYYFHKHPVTHRSLRGVATPRYHENPSWIPLLSLSI